MNTWILVIIAFNTGGGYSPSITSIEMNSRESCVSAVKFSKSRQIIKDAYCIKK